MALDLLEVLVITIKFVELSPSSLISFLLLAIWWTSINEKCSLWNKRGSLSHFLIDSRSKYQFKVKQAQQLASHLFGYLIYGFLDKTRSFEGRTSSKMILKLADDNWIFKSWIFKRNVWILRHDNQPREAPCTLHKGVVYPQVKLPLPTFAE